MVTLSRCWFNSSWRCFYSDTATLSYGNATVSMKLEDNLEDTEYFTSILPHAMSFIPIFFQVDRRRKHCNDDAAVTTITHHRATLYYIGMLCHFQVDPPFFNCSYNVFQKVEQVSGLNRIKHIFLN